MAYTKRILGLMESIVNAFALVGTISVVGMFFLILGDVLGRASFNAPITGTMEISEYLVVVAAFSALGYAQLKGRHVSMELLTSRFSPRLQAWLRVFTLLIAVIVFTVMSWKLTEATYQAWRDNVTHWGTDFSLPTWPPNLIAAIGSALLVLALLTQIARNIAFLFTRDKSWIR